VLKLWTAKADIKAKSLWREKHTNAPVARETLKAVKDLQHRPDPRHMAVLGDQTYEKQPGKRLSMPESVGNVIGQFVS
jgi:hypothetical protein